MQVKVNGYRIELAEVEFAFAASDLVEQAVVLVRGGQLAAYVKLTAKAAPHPSAAKTELWTLVKRSLTTYMVPK